MPISDSNAWLEGVLYVPDADPVLLTRALLTVGAHRIRRHTDIARRLLNHTDPIVRSTAMGVLLNALKEPSAPALATRMLFEDPAPEARASVAAEVFMWALARPAHRAQVVAALHHVAHADADEEVQSSAARCLRALQGKGVD